MKKEYINFLKVLSILFVINIHLLSKAWNQGIPTSLNFKILTFIDIAFLVCVPIFAMCSGNIFLNRDDSNKKIIFKYALKIYLIFILFTILYKVVDAVVYQNAHITFNIFLRMLKDAICLKSIYHLWYLRVVLAMYLSIPLFKLLFKVKNKYTDHIILFIIVLLVKVLPIMLKTSWFLTFIGIFGFVIYFYLGYYLDKYYSNKLLLLFIPIALVSYYYTFIKTINTSISAGYPTVEHMQYLSYNIMFVSIFIFLLVRRFKDVFNKNNVKKLLDFLTKYNFNVYLFHGFTIGLLSKLNVINIYSYKHFILIFVYGIITYMLTLLYVIPIKLFISKFKMVKKN